MQICNENDRVFESTVEHNHSTEPSITKGRLKVYVISKLLGKAL